MKLEEGERVGVDLRGIIGRGGRWLQSKYILHTYTHMYEILKTIKIYLKITNLARWHRGKRHLPPNLITRVSGDPHG